ncbi:hypothetical protein PLICRDRAFT_664349 [Plicaturopsis crispa FD-325 SS-3]|nr:hypothetical protein PLICRDRAFT_664349 [Plicaturopsis crispa FD-325 SS-3]
MPRHSYRPRTLRCPSRGCNRLFASAAGRTQHFNSAHTAAPSPPPSPPPPPPGFHFPNPQDMPLGLDENDLGRASHSPRARSDPPDQAGRDFHPSIYGQPCNEHGIPLAPNAPPAPRNPNLSQSDWAPFDDRVQFELSEFLFTKVEMSQNNIHTLMELWAASLLPHGGHPPLSGHHDMHTKIDNIPHGNVPWQSFSVTPADNVAADSPSWMHAEYDVWFRDPREVARVMLDNPDFEGELDYGPYRDFDKNGNRVLKDFMSGDWSWRQADKIAEDPANDGAVFVPVILGSDKTTVSVATGQNEYYPLYFSPANLHNNVRRSHRNSVIPIGFLAIPKSERKYDNDLAFRKFRRQLFHASVSAILQTLKPGMTTAEVFRFPDGHFRRVIFGLGPYIADYPEQVLLAGVVQGWCPRCTAMPDDLDGEGGPRSQRLTDELVASFDPALLWDAYGIVADVIPFTNDFPRADIHELLAPDLLHQIIKGTFKDHLVTWVGDYLIAEHGEKRGNEILDDIDRRIAATPSFPGLRRFPQGRRFKQWTGDDSKALMKVYLPALVGYVPSEMVKCLSAFLDFCYLVRRSVHTVSTLDAIDDALRRFHEYRTVFEGVRPSGFSLPRQHSLVHYRQLIVQFGAPNGLCSSITESKHIKAVKRPWRRSSRFNLKALGQMLVTNQRLDKLAAARVYFTERGMLSGSAYTDALARLEELFSQSRSPSAAPDAGNAAPRRPHSPSGEGDGDDEAVDVEGPTVLGFVRMARTPRDLYPRAVHDLARAIGHPQLPTLIRLFLHDQLNPDAEHPAEGVHLSSCPNFEGQFAGTGRDRRVRVFHSAYATFYAPSDPSGVGGMRREVIRSTPCWRGKHARRDCVFAERDRAVPGIRGLHVLRVLLLFSFTFNNTLYPCALVGWFSLVGDAPDADTGLWTVEPDLNNRGDRDISVVHLDSIMRSAHLIPVFGDRPIPIDFHPSYSLDCFDSFYVNKWADHHAHEIIF